MREFVFQNRWSPGEVLLQDDNHHRQRHHNLRQCHNHVCQRRVRHASDSTPHRDGNAYAQPLSTLIAISIYLYTYPRIEVSPYVYSYAGYVRQQGVRLACAFATGIRAVNGCRLFVRRMVAHVWRRLKLRRPIRCRYPGVESRKRVLTLLQYERRLRHAVIRVAVVAPGSVSHRIITL